MKRRAAILFFGTVFGLLLATLLALQSETASKIARGVLERELRNQLYSKVEIESVRIRLLSFQPRVDLYEVKITPKAPGALPQYTEPTLRAERVRIVIRPLQLLASRFDIERVELTKPHADLEVRNGKIVGLPLPLTDDTGKEAPAEPGTPSVRIDAFLVKSGILHLKVDEPESEYGITQIRALGTIEPNDAVVIDFEAEGRRMRIRLGEADFEEPIDRLAGHLVLDGKSLELTDAVAEVGPVFAKATGSISLAKGPIDVQLAELQARLPLELVKRIDPASPLLEGVADYRGSLSVRGSRVAARGSAKVPDFRLDGFKFGDADADLELAGSRAKATRLVLAYADGKVAGTGELSWTDDKLRLAADLLADRVSFAQVLDAVKVEGAHVDMRVSGPITFEGPLAPMQLAGHAKLTHHDFTWRDRPWNEAGPFNPNLRVPGGALEGDFVVHQDGLRFQNVNGVAGGTVFTADAALDFAGAADVTLSALPFDLGELSPLGAVKVAGRGPAKIRVHGKLEELVIEGELDLDGAKIADFDFGRAAGKILFKDLVLASERTVFTRGRSTYAGPWRVDFHDPLSLDFDVEARAARLEDLADVVFWNIPASEWVNGEVTGKIDLHGPLDKLSGSYTASAAQATIAGETFARLLAKGRWKEGVIWADDIVATKASGAQVYLRGSLAPPIPGEEALGGPLNVEVLTSKLTLSDLTTLGPDPSLTSEAALRMHIGGRFNRPDFRGRLDLAGTRLHGTPLGASQANFTTAGDVLGIDGTLAGGSVLGVGRVKLWMKPFLPFEVDLAATRHSIKPYLHGFNPRLAKDEDVKATVSGGFKLRGSLETPGSTKVEVDASEVAVSAGAHKVANTRPVRMTFGNGVTEIRSFDLAGDETRFSLAGRTTAEGIHDYHASGDIDLAFTPLLTDVLSRVEGVLHVKSLAIQGRRGAADVKGDLEVENGVFKNRYFPLALEDVHGKIRVTEDAITFEENVTGRANGGGFEGAGRMYLDGASVRNWDLHATLSDVPVRFSSAALSARGSGKLEFTGSTKNSKPKLSGDLDLADVRFTAPFDWKSKAVAFQQQRVVANIASEEQRLFNMDILLRADDNLWVKNELMNVEWHTRADDPLRIKGDTAEWGLRGTIEAERGKVVFQDRDFDVTRAQVRFTDDKTIDGPYELAMETVIRDWEIAATITGRISTGINPPEYQVDPPGLSNEDVTMLMLAGLTQEEANRQGISAGLGVIISVAGQGLGDQRGNFSQRVKKTGIVDSFEIVPSYEGGEIKLKGVGRKQVSQDLSLSGSVAPGDKTTHNFQADYRVNKRMHVVLGWTNEETEGGSASQTSDALTESEVSVDAKFRFEWE